MKPRPELDDDRPLTPAEIRAIEALAAWQAQRDFARLVAGAPRPARTLDPADQLSDIATPPTA